MNSSTPRDAVHLSPNAITVLEKRYLTKDETGKPVESPEDLFWRVARTIAEADRRYGASVGAACGHSQTRGVGDAMTRLLVDGAALAIAAIAASAATATIAMRSRIY